MIGFCGFVEERKNMKYNYRKSAVVYQWVSELLLIAGFIYLMYLDKCEIKRFVKNVTYAISLFLGINVMFAGEYLRRYVEFRDTYVCFNSFRMPRLTIKKPVTLNVPYSDILRIQVLKLPVIGVVRMKVITKDFYYGIPISFLFCKHNKMFAEFVKRATEFSPNVNIDDKLLKYLRKKGLYED